MRPPDKTPADRCLAAGSFRTLSLPQHFPGQLLGSPQCSDFISAFLAVMDK